MDQNGRLTMTSIQEREHVANLRRKERKETCYPTGHNFLLTYDRTAGPGVDLPIRRR